MAWEYQDLLNQNLQILLVLAFGAASVAVGTFRPDRDLRTFNTFVFAILLPASVIQGMGIRSDLRDGDTWRFVGGFLMLRAICLAAAWLLFGVGLRRGIGEVTASWMFLSWVSTVILGVPLVRAALGPAYVGLPVVAAISSYIFQLPLMLILFSIHAGQKSAEDLPAVATVTLPEAVSSPNGAAGVQQPPGSRRARLTRAQARQIGRQLVFNPILVAIAIGFILSITTLGPRYLYPGNPPAQPNCDYAPGAGFIYMFLSSLAACTEPVALFAMGIFLVGKNPLSIGWWKAALYMLLKCIVVPLLMVGCAFAVGLEGATARVSVLLAALPISAASFTLCDKYGACPEAAVANIFFGNLLVLPTTIGWMAVMDGLSLFEASKSATPDVCAARPPPPVQPSG